MKKTMILFLIVTLFVSIIPLEVFAESTNVTKIEIESVEAYPGDKVDVNIRLENNPGIVSSSIKVSFDENLTLVGAKNGNVFPKSISFIPPKQLATIGRISSSCRFVWQGFDIADAEIQDGVMLTLSFELSQRAQAGEKYTILVTSEQGDVVDRDLNSIILSAEGKVSVLESQTLECKHENAYDVAGKEPGCEENGLSAGRFCPTCNVWIVPQEEIAAVGHIGGRATCVEQAVCERCGKTYGQMDSSNHRDIVTDSAVAATCQRTGLTEGIHCEACKTILLAQKEIGKIAHMPVSADNGVNPKCGVEGKEADTICAVCGELLEKGKKLEALSHTGGTATCVEKAICDRCGVAYGEIDNHNHKEVVVDPAVDATCEATGVTEGMHCKACGMILVEQVVTEKKAHIPVSAGNKIDAKCLVEGKEADVICSICGKVLEKGKTIESLGHTGGTATCKNKAVCERCGEEYGELDNSNHENVKTNLVVEPSCTKTGIAEKYCIACGKTLVKTETIPALGHKDRDRNGRCDVCGEVMGEETIAGSVQIKLSETKLVLGMGEKMVVKATVISSYANNQPIVWSSSNTKVVTVKNGRIQAKRKGKAVVFAEIGNVKTSCKVTVKAAPKAIRLNAAIKVLKKGKTFGIKVRLPKKTASNRISYVSSNKKVVSVSSTGKVRAMKKGAAIITVKTYNKKKATMKIIVQ